MKWVVLAGFFGYIGGILAVLGLTRSPELDKNEHPHTEPYTDEEKFESGV